MIKGSEIFNDSITKKIIVWKDIIPNVNEGSTGNKTTEFNNNDNIWEIETREGDGDLDLVLDLVGGNPSKWVIDNPTIENSDPTGTPNKVEREYTYTIKGEDLKANNDGPQTYTYTFKPRYDDGMTKNSESYKFERKYSITVWPKPEMSVSDFALTDAYNHKIERECY